MPVRILLVDDEPLLVKLFETFLRQRGYDVDACMRSRAALDLFSAGPDRYTLVIADVGLPDIPGDELVLRIGELSATVRFLLTSGLPYNPEQFPENVRNRLLFLQKPFLPRMVIDAVTRLLEDGKRSQPAENAR